MIVIGELINGMYKDVAKAIANRETSVIQGLAQDQVRAGAGIIDINVGPYSTNQKDDMKWLVSVIQGAVNVPLSIDSTNAEVIEEGLKLAKARSIVNSTTAEDDKLDKMFGLAKKYNAQIIGIVMDKSGIPGSKEGRLELASKIVAKAMDCSIATEDLYLDPIAMPVNVAQAHGPAVLETIRDLRLLCDPAPQTVIGLSNVSQGTKKFRGLINRTFLAMAMANGLTAAILDPLDKELMDAVITAEIILNKNIYCDSFLDAYRKR